MHPKPNGVNWDPRQPERQLATLSRISYGRRRQSEWKIDGNVRSPGVVQALPEQASESAVHVSPRVASGIAIMRRR
jgi:hypothetical protein